LVKPSTSHHRAGRFIYCRTLLMRRLFMALVLGSLFSLPELCHAAPPVEDYGKLPAIDMVRLSPSGGRYAYVADDGRTRALVVATADRKPIDGVNVGSVKVRSVEWAGDDFLLVSLSSTVSRGPDF